MELDFPFDGSLDRGSFQIFVELPTSISFRGGIFVFPGKKVVMCQISFSVGPILLPAINLKERQYSGIRNQVSAISAASAQWKFHALNSASKIVSNCVWRVVEISGGDRTTKIAMNLKKFSSLR